MWIDAARETPAIGIAVIVIWGGDDEDVGWAVMTADDGWYSANPDGSPINRCPAPQVWCLPPAGAKGETT